MVEICRIKKMALLKLGLDARFKVEKKEVLCFCVQQDPIGLWSGAMRKGISCNDSLWRSLHGEAWIHKVAGSI
jgi:hypothetical protein